MVSLGIGSVSPASELPGRSELFGSLLLYLLRQLGDGKADERATDAGQKSGSALEAMYRLFAWLIPHARLLPRSQKFPLADRIRPNPRP